MCHHRIASPVPQQQKTANTASDQSQKPSDEPRPYCSQFDLTKRVPSTVLDQANIDIMQWDMVADGEEEDQDDYESLISKIRKVVLDGNFSSAVPVAPGTPRHALRVAIHSLASPSWQSKSTYVSALDKRRRGREMMLSY